MRGIGMIVLLALACVACLACGGPPVPPADEVTESWTSGDDEPLERDAE